ncbi:MAG: hypothetical protein Q9163_002372 [Psora crenata]
MAASSQDSTTSALPAYKTAFLQACLSANVLTFGTYTLKSGRQSPYFFNAGLLHTSTLLSAISTAYAHTIISFLSTHHSIPKPDILFGPAYKGIGLACTTLLELYRIDPQTWSSVSYSFNRKEIKDHGEGGNIVGASLKGKNVLVIDDVITAGTAIKEAINLVIKEGGKVIGFIVALDRVEKIPGPGDGNGRSAMGQIEWGFGIHTASIATVDDLIAVLRDKGDPEDIKRLEEYRKKYLANK